MAKSYICNYLSLKILCHLGILDASRGAFEFTNDADRVLSDFASTTDKIDGTNIANVADIASIAGATGVASAACVVGAAFAAGVGDKGKISSMMCIRSTGVTPE